MALLAITHFYVTFWLTHLPCKIQRSFASDAGPKGIYEGIEDQGLK